MYVYIKYISNLYIMHVYVYMSFVLTRYSRPVARSRLVNGYVDSYPIWYENPQVSRFNCQTLMLYTNFINEIQNEAPSPDRGCES